MLFRFGRQVRSNPATDTPNSLSLFPENGVLGNYDPTQSELGENVTLQALDCKPDESTALLHSIKIYSFP
jgi:hypothetical protein